MQLCSLSYNQTFCKGSRLLRRSRWVWPLCSVLPHPVLTSQKLCVFKKIKSKQNKNVCLPREPDEKLNFSCRESRGWVSRLILSSSALYHTVLMLISLFLHANMLFCLSKLNKKLQYKEVLVVFLFRWCSLFIRVVLVSSSQVNSSALSDLVDYTFWWLPLIYQPEIWILVSGFDETIGTRIHWLERIGIVAFTAKPEGAEKREILPFGC